MCKVGDIIVIQNYKSGEKELCRHSFIVLNDEGGQISGLSYDLVCNVMSSFKSEEQKVQKLKYPGNFPISHEDSTVVGNKKDGYIKSEQLYYFDKGTIDYMIIGSMNEDVFKALIEYISQLKISLEHIIDNLK